MARKTNPNILRLGVIKNWDSRYIEKKSSEIPFYDFKNIEIWNFLEHFFKKNGLNIHHCKLHFSESNIISIFVAFYAKPAPSLPKPSRHWKRRRMPSGFNLLDTTVESQSYLHLNYIKKLTYKNFKALESKNYYDMQKKKTCNGSDYYKKINHLHKEGDFKLQDQRLINYKSGILRQLGTNGIWIKKSSDKKGLVEKNSFKLTKTLEFIKNKQHTNKKKLVDDNFITRLRYCLSRILNTRNLKVKLILRQLNKNFWQASKSKFRKVKKVLWWYSRLKKYDFYKESMQINYVNSKLSNSAALIAKLIATHFKKLRRQNFFTTFIIKSLKAFWYLHKDSTSLKGVKIKLSGRFNWRPRARHKFFKIGEVIPLFWVNSKVDYAEATSFTPNGTLGVKVWTLSKNL